MPDNKNQHYVPRCYLKAFTHDRQGAAIDLYNIRGDRLIPWAPVKNQCAKDYFYGNDLLVERGLQPVEAAYGVLLGSLLTRRAPLSAQQEQFLKEFWVLQQLRTDAASKRVMATEEGIRQVLGEAHQLPPATEREAIQIALGGFPHHAHSVIDLSLRLIVNRTPVPFITCDDPAMLANRWYAVDPRAAQRSFGFASSGALLLMPLSPELYLVGYDSGVYRIDATDRWVTIKDRRDVDALNQHAYLRALSNLYVHDAAQWPEVVRGLTEVLGRRGENRARTGLAVAVGGDRFGQRFRFVNRAFEPTDQEGIIRFWYHRAQPRTWPSFLRWRDGGHVFSNGSAAGFVRRATVPPDGPPFAKLPAR